MFRSVVSPDGALHLGEAARALGFKPGQLVEITLNITGSLLLVLGDDHDIIDLPPLKPLPSKRGRPLAISLAAAP